MDANIPSVELAAVAGIESIELRLEECLRELDKLELHLPAAHLDMALIELRRGRSPRDRA